MQSIKKSVLVFALLFSISISAQPDSLFLIKPKEKLNLGWNTKNEVGFYLNQVSFSNWNAGGTNSISAILSGKASAKYKEETYFWNSSLNLRYGLNKQEKQSLFKTEDVIEVISNFGIEKSPESNWFYSARFSFNTQFANGYSSPDDNNPISRFMAPGYVFLGAGMEYGRHIERFSLYASPLTLKTTFVLDEALANQGAFGVKPAIYDMDGNIVKKGENTRQEFGMLFTGQFEDEVFENIKLNSRLRLYTDYLVNFGNVDVDWEVNLDMKVNKFVQATLGSHLRYDHDIKAEVETNEITNEEVVVEGPKIQWKQLLGVGVVVDLDSIVAGSSEP
ncbi:MAG: hypothetical protein CMC05_04295 [Flavobacteriaceae bacterium]|nr:hypothetical protein [Flavobacteriaceae bacterium]MBD09297.1 hypothetical protein [Flavobacteriaceae bacterium]|tara:strand:+ start:79 stop:1080 length:1002 start_codon:yes stop_codon:yes gene_type:complete